MSNCSAARLTQAVLRRRLTGCARSAAISPACVNAVCATRSVSSQPNLLGLASTVKEAAVMTVQATVSRHRLFPHEQRILQNYIDGARRGAVAASVPVSLPAPAQRGAFTASAIAALPAAGAAAATAALNALSFTAPLYTAKRYHSSISGAGGAFAPSAALLAGRPTGTLRSPKQQTPGSSANQLQGVNAVDRYREEEEEEQHRDEGEQQDPFNTTSGPGYLPFPPPFHTFNVIMFLFIANVLCYLAMNFGSDDLRDFLVEHLTLSHENFHRIYPILTNALYQENLLQLLIDCWLLWQFGDVMLAFLGNIRLTFFVALCTVGGSFIHVGRQWFELHYGMDELEVRGRCYGPNPMIMGLISMEGLIFRHLNFIQQPPVPFLVLTAFVMVIDVWRIFTTKPEEHGAATGGALMAYLFWALPTRFLGLDKLTATL